MTNKDKTTKTLYKKWWFWVVATFLLIILAKAITIEEAKNEPIKVETSASTEAKEAKKEKSEDKPEQDVKDKKEEPKEVEDVIVVSASELYQAYKANEIAADQAYKDKQLEVKGAIKDIGKDIAGRMYITLDTDDVLGSVQAFFGKEEEDTIASLSKAQSVTIVGKGDGLAAVNVLIKKSKVKE